MHQASQNFRKKHIIDEDPRQPSSQLFSPKLTLFSNHNSKSLTVLKIKCKEKAAEDKNQGKSLSMKFNPYRQTSYALIKIPR